MLRRTLALLSAADMLLSGDVCAGATMTQLSDFLLNSEMRVHLLEPDGPPVNCGITVHHSSLLEAKAMG